MFIVFKHDTKYGETENYFSFGNNVNPNFVIHCVPHIVVTHNKLALQKTSVNSVFESIPEEYQNEQLMLWFTKSGNRFKVKLCDMDKTINENLTTMTSFQANRILISMRYYI